MDYYHTQKAPLYLILLAVGAALVVSAVMNAGHHALALILTVAAGLFVLVGLMFRQLTICDEGDFLAARFGPVPAFGTSIRYDEISEVEESRSSWIDGWGVHYVPGRGATYNLWGYDCVKLVVDGRTIRLGTDDPEGLAAFLRGKLETRGGGPAAPSRSTCT